MKFLLILQLFFASVAFAGGETSGGGGNGFAAEFRRFAQQASQAMFEHQVIQVQGRNFDFRAFRAGVDSAAIVATRDRLVLNGLPVSAINYPLKNTIVFNVDDWAKLSQDSKIQLVIHEFLGLKYSNTINDSDYRWSADLLNLTKTFTVESVALDMARAGHASGFRMRLIPQRTKVIHRAPGKDGISSYQVTEVAIQTFENSSPTSVRIFRITFYDALGVTKAELFKLEGAAGP
ncbi:MAG: hypothetical protein KF802_07550 [Bdellovibrionaceae bacterium]|nr:hypothetical protein [Pseudobdellovibrionaceae bacterium]MBX3032973.1 hypothetical protein [Pseudobdellovibrionaceae bacterium]